MDLQHVDVRPQAPHTGVDRVEDVLPRQPDAVDPDGPVVGGAGGDGGGAVAVLVDAQEALGQDDDALARDVVLLEGLADDLLGAAVGVDVCGIPRVDPPLVRVLEQRQGLVLVEHPLLPLPGAVGHGAQDDLGDLEAGLAEAVAVVSNFLSPICR